MTENLIITEVTKSKNWFSISTKGGMGFGMEDKYKVTPKVGDKITLYTVNGSTIRGIDLKRNHWMQNIKNCLSVFKNELTNIEKITVDLELITKVMKCFAVNKQL